MKLLLTVQYILERDSSVLEEVGFRIPRIGFWIPGTGFRIPKPWIPDSKGKKMLDSGFRIPLHKATGRMIRSLRSALTSPAESFASLLTFLSTISTSASETQFFGKLLVYQWALTTHPYWLIYFSTLSSTISCS